MSDERNTGAPPSAAAQDDPVPSPVLAVCPSNGAVPLPLTSGDWYGYDRFEDGRFVAAYLLDLNQEPDLREMAVFNCANVAGRVAAALSGRADDTEAAFKAGWDRRHTRDPEAPSAPDGGRQAAWESYRVDGRRVLVFGDLPDLASKVARTIQAYDHKEHRVAWSQCSATTRAYYQGIARAVLTVLGGSA